jgi:hypothetical protein
MPLDPAFVADCPYLPEGLFIDEIVEVDREASRVVVSMPTHAELPLTRTQRVHPQRHPRHVNGGLMVHMTGIAGFVHAYYVLDLRHSEGWVGYGGRIRAARYHALAEIGEPIRIEVTATQAKIGATRGVARYDFRMSQRDELVYTSDQTAMWLKVEESAG